MAFSFWTLFRGRAAPAEVRAQELFSDAAADYGARQLALSACINLIANAVGRADFRTFENGKEVFGELWYRWNVEPNRNQNSSVFLHRLIYKLCTEGEALVVSQKRRTEDRLDMFVADDWEKETESVLRENRYRHVKVGSFEFNRSFAEADTLHLYLNAEKLTPVLTGLLSSYEKLLNIAVSAYEYTGGQHWKIHADRVRRGDNETEETLRKIMEQDIKTFLSAPRSAILEYDGLTYTDVSKGGGKENLADTRTLFEDIFNLTARAFGIPISLIEGKVEGTKDATERFLSECIDPIADQLQEEIQRKEWSFSSWQAGSFIRVDTSAIRHFDLFENAAAVEKLVGSGAYSINELRRAANQPRIDEPWADAHYMTLNISGVGEQTREL